MVVEFLKALSVPFALLGVAVSILLWWRSGFWAPRFVHVLANLSGVLGLVLAWMAWSTDHPMKERHLWLAALFPALVYLAFAYYGRSLIEEHLAKSSREDRPAA